MEFQLITSNVIEADEGGEAVPHIDDKGAQQTIRKWS
jgi:hypothetical protein